MTDQQIIQGLISRDNRVTEDFFFVKCRPLFCSVIKSVFDYEVDFDEFVNELYLYLMEDDAAKLRGFQYRSSVFQWLKVVAIRYFIKKRDNLIDTDNVNPLMNGIPLPQNYRPLLKTCIVCLTTCPISDMPMS